jgi:hypothetical protein
MAPPAKKQKVNNSKSPIVFQSPGLKPDVSLKVFDVEFHVNSTLLKLHSAFFRTFLDSADKVTSASTNITANADSGNGSTSDTTPPEVSATRESMVYGEMKYKWVTKVEEGEKDKWHLVADNPKVCSDILRFAFNCLKESRRMSLSISRSLLAIRKPRRKCSRNFCPASILGHTASIPSSNSRT